MASGDALDQAIAAFREPSRVGELRDRALADEVILVLRVAAGDREAMAQAQQRTNDSEEQLQEAAVFYLQQVLFTPNASAYRVLGCAFDAPHHRLRENYRWLIKWLHPDRNTDQWESVYADKVNIAWQSVKTADRRRRYDESQGLEGLEFEAPATGLAVQSPARSVPGGGSGVLLSGNVVRHLPAITLSIMGLGAVLMLGLMYWVNQDSQPPTTVSRGEIAQANPAPPSQTKVEVAMDPAPADLTLVSENHQRPRFSAEVLAVRDPLITDEPAAVAGDSPSAPSATVLEDLAAALASAQVPDEPIPTSGVPAEPLPPPEPVAVPPREESAVPLALDDTPPPSRPMPKAVADPPPAEPAPVQTADSPTAVAVAAEPATAPSERAKSPAELITPTQRNRPRAVAPANAVAAAPSPSVERSRPVAQTAVTDPTAESELATSVVDQSLAAADESQRTPIDQRSAPAAAQNATDVTAVEPAPTTPTARRPSASEAAALVNDFASAYTAGDLIRFDRLFSPAAAVPPDLGGFRARMREAQMRYLELADLRWEIAETEAIGYASYRETFVPNGERRAVTRQGNLQWVIVMSDAQPRISALRMQAQ